MADDFSWWIVVRPNELFCKNAREFSKNETGTGRLPRLDGMIHGLIRNP
jgi:hypothetical protein